MQTISSLPNTIPIFPLSGALLLPHSRLPLNIFEPRYLAMIDDVLKTDHRMIGLIQPRATPKDKSDDALQQIGCVGRLTSFSETDDKRYLITLSGICRFRTLNVTEGFLPYKTAEVQWNDFQQDLSPTQPDEKFDRPRFLNTLDRYFQIMDLSSDWGGLKDADEELLINSLSMLCPFEPEEKQALLEAPLLENRRETLVTLMEFALRHDDASGAMMQ